MSWIIVCRIIQAILNLVISTISARYLGPSNYGLISYASSIVAFMLPLVQLGLRNILVQELIESPEHEGEILGTTVISCVLSSILGVICVIGIVSILNRSEVDTIIVCSLYSVSLFFQSLEIIHYWFQAKMLSKYTSITSLIAYVLISVYKAYLLINRKSIFWFAVTNSLDYLLISVILFYFYQKNGGQRFSFSFDRFKNMFQKSRYYIVSGMMVTVFAQTDKIMLKLMINETETGFYSAAVTCAGMTSFVFSAIIDSFRPVIFTTRKTNHDGFEKWMARLYSIIIYIGLAQSIVLCGGAELIVQILYGANFAPTSTILSIITWYSAFSYMGSVRNIWILAEDKQNVLWIINLSGALLNVVGNLILIPKFGACGAAVALSLIHI